MMQLKIQLKHVIFAVFIQTAGPVSFKNIIWDALCPKITVYVCTVCYVREIKNLHGYNLQRSNCFIEQFLSV